MRNQLGKQGVLADGVGKVFAREGDNAHFEPLLAQQLAASQLRAALEAQQSKWMRAGAGMPPPALAPLRQCVLELFRLLTQLTADGLALLLEGGGGSGSSGSSSSSSSSSSWIGGLSFHPEFFAALHGAAAGLYALAPLALLSGNPGVEGGKPVPSLSFLGAGDEVPVDGVGGAAVMRCVIERACSLLEGGTAHPQLGAAMSYVVYVYGSVGLHGSVGALHILSAIKDGEAPAETPLFLVSSSSARVHL